VCWKAGIEGRGLGFFEGKTEKGLIFNIYKELKKLDSRKSDNTILKNGDGSKQRILN
jgi:hypothetical protein